MLVNNGYNPRLGDHKLFCRHIKLEWTGNDIRETKKNRTAKLVLGKKIRNLKKKYKGIDNVPSEPKILTLGVSLE